MRKAMAKSLLLNIEVLIKNPEFINYYRENYIKCKNIFFILI